MGQRPRTPKLQPRAEYDDGTLAGYCELAGYPPDAWCHVCRTLNAVQMHETLRQWEPPRPTRTKFNPHDVARAWAARWR